MKRLFFVPALIISVFLASCGGNKTAEDNADTTLADTALPDVVSTPAASDTAVSNTINLTGNDQMKYDKTVLRVKAGETVKLTLKNVGTMPKDAMAHNFILLKPGTDIEQFALKAATEKDNGYIPADMKSVILAQTTMVGPGETTTVEFTVPKGEYEYFCSFPGHWGTMRGKLIAE